MLHLWVPLPTTNCFCLPDRIGTEQKKKAQEQQMAHSQILVTRKAVKRIFKTSQCPQTIPRKFCLFFFFPIKMGPPSPTTEFGVNNDFTILNFIAFIFWR